MNKIELYEIYQKHSSVDHQIWDSWFHWRLKQAGWVRNPDQNPAEHQQWLDILHSTPNHYDWRPTLNNTIEVTWEGGKQEFPLSDIVEDLDKEPDLQMLWHSGYWDGPLSGMATYNGECVWFDCCDETDSGDRIFELFRLSESNKDELFRRHALFQKHVGFNCDHDPNVYQEYSGGDNPKKYYKLQKKFTKLDTKTGEVIAKVHWFQFSNWARPR